MASGSPSRLWPRPQLEVAAGALERVAAGAAEIDAEAALVSAPASESTRLIEVVRALDEAGVDATDVHRREATLDDVFLAITRTGERKEAPSR